MRITGELKCIAKPSSPNIAKFLRQSTNPWKNQAGLADFGSLDEKTRVDAKPISITDVARECGCSIATVSLVLNSRGKISPKTKNRVMRAVARMGYVPNIAGRSLRSHRTNTIGLFFYPSCGQLFRNVFYAEVMEGLEQRLVEARYDLLLSSSDFGQEDNRSISLISQRRVDAAIMLGAFPFDQIERLAKLRTPSLLLDSNLDELPIDSVTTDGLKGGRMVVDHLHSHGHRRIVMLAYQREDYNIDMRIKGFLAGMEAHNLPTKDAVIRGIAANAQGFPLLLRRLNAANAPTAVVCVNDTMAVYMMQHVKDAGFRVPEQISFVGYDDDILAREALPRLTTVAVDKPNLGRIGADVILRRIGDPELPVTKTRLPVQLIERDSVGVVAS